MPDLGSLKVDLEGHRCLVCVQSPENDSRKLLESSKKLMVKQKTRHLLFEIVWKDKQRPHEISQKEFTGLVFKEISRLYGPIGTANILPNLAVRFFEARSCLCILRCSRDQQQQVVISLAHHN